MPFSGTRWTGSFEWYALRMRLWKNPVRHEAHEGREENYEINQ